MSAPDRMSAFELIGVFLEVLRDQRYQPEEVKAALERWAGVVKPPAGKCQMCHGAGWYWMANAYPPGVEAPKVKVDCKQCKVAA